MYLNKTGKRALAELAFVPLSPCDTARSSTALAKNLSGAWICATERD